MTRNDSEPSTPNRTITKDPDRVGVPFELMSVPLPCLVGDAVYTSENITTAPGAVTLERFSGINDISRVNKELARNRSSITEYRHTTIAPPECIYSVAFRESWFVRYKILLAQLMRGTCSISQPNLNSQEGGLCALLPVDSSSPAAPSPSYLERGSPFWLERLARLPKRSQPELSAYMDNFAEAMTRRIRADSLAIPSRSKADAEWRPAFEAVLGEILRTTTCYAVDWRWLILSIALTVLTTGALIWTIIRGAMREDVVWKSSILPLFYYRDRIVVIDRDGGEETKDVWASDQALMGMKEMKADSKRVRVVF